MKKRLLLMLAALVLILSACQSNTPTAEPQPEASATPKEMVTTVPSAEPSATTGSTEAVAKAPGCTVKSPQPTPGPTEESIFPSPGEGDWIKGPADAEVTIIEYSDFQ
jgi:ABC-type Fe3+-hydroxamate transport system substrate-binding protein